MGSVTARYNLLLFVSALVIAACGVLFNYYLTYREQLALAKDMLAHVARQDIAEPLDREMLDKGGRPPSPEQLHRLLFSHLHMPNVAPMAAMLNEEGRVIDGIGLPAEARILLERVRIEPSGGFIEEGSFIFLAAWGEGTPYRVVAGFDKSVIVGGLRSGLIYTGVFVALGLGFYFGIAFLLFRHMFVSPMVRFLEDRLRACVEGIISGAPRADDDRQASALLPDGISTNFERSVSMLNAWAQHKASLDQFISISISENNKHQLARNLYQVIRNDFAVTNLTIFEINHSVNRLELVYDARGSDYPSELLNDPQNCFAYRSGSPLTQALGQELCSHCGLASGETVMCRPLVAGGKEIGTCKIVIDSQSLDGRFASVPDSVRKLGFAEALLDPYVKLLSLSLSNLTLLDSYKNKAITDGLTGLYNRRYVVEYLSNILSLSRRNSLATSVLIIDVDNFKRLNDEYGHSVGDRVLRVVAQTMRRSIRDCDTIARYGGEEFIVVLPETDRAAAAEVAERIRMAVAGIEWNREDLGNIPQVTISIGVAEFPLHGYSHYHLTNAADKALYVAKRSGKNRVVVHQALPVA